MSSVCDEVNAALLDFDLMLDEEMKKAEITTSNSKDQLLLLQSPEPTSSSSSLASGSSSSVLSGPVRTHPALKRNVKDLITQIQRSSVTPSPPLSPTSPPVILPTSANVKNIINKMQTSPTSPIPDKTSPVIRKSLASDRISRFLDNDNISEKEKAPVVAITINKIQSPFLMMENTLLTTKNTSVVPLTKHQQFKKSLKRSKSYDDLVQEKVEEEVTQDINTVEQDMTGLDHNHVTNDQLLLQDEDDHCQVFDFDKGDYNEETNLLSCRRPLRRAGGPMKRKYVAKRTTPPPDSLTTPPLTTLSPVSLIEVKESLQSSSEDEGLTSFESDLDKEGRSRSAVPVHTQSLNVPKEQRSKGTSPRREIKSVGDNYEIDKENDNVTQHSGGHLVEESHEFTAGISVDSLDHLNYQWRHSMEPSDRYS